MIGPKCTRPGENLETRWYILQPDGQYLLVRSSAGNGMTGRDSGPMGSATHNGMKRQDLRWCSPERYMQAMNGC